MSTPENFYTFDQFSVLVRLRGVLLCVRAQKAIRCACTFPCDNKSDSLSQTRKRCHLHTKSNSGSQVYVTLCQNTTKSWETHDSQRRTRRTGRCVCELSSASGHSIHCWACRPLYRHTNSVSSRKQTHSPLTRTRGSWTFGRAVLNILVLARFTWEFPGVRISSGTQTLSHH